MSFCWKRREHLLARKQPRRPTVVAQSNAVQMYAGPKSCHQPGAITAGEVLARKQDQRSMAHGVCLLLQEWEQLSSSKK